MLPSYAERDLPFFKEATAKLRAALHLPSTDPHVARWLFSNPHHMFHPDAGVLPPEVFANALSVRMSLDYRDAMSGSNPFASPLPIYGDLSSGEPTSSASLNMMLIPAARVGSLILGYSMITATPHDSMLNPFEVHLEQGQCIKERFCYDPDTKHMVVVLNALSKEATGIVSIDWLGDNRRQRCFFTVPNRDYDFLNLPNQVLAILHHVEHKVADSPSQVETTCVSPVSGHTDMDNASGNENVIDATVDPVGKSGFAEDLETLQGLDGLLGLLPDNGSGMVPSIGDVADILDGSWDVRNTGATTETSTALQTVSTHPFGNTTASISLSRSRGDNASVGPFSMNSMYEALSGLEGILKGKFFAPKLKRDVLDPMTGEIVSRTSGEMRATMERASDKSFDVFKEVTVQSYYATTLAVSTDRLLAYPSQDRGKRRKNHDVETETVSSKRARASQDERVENIGSSDRESRKEPVDKEMEKARRLEARKQRNRESAARSNQRKKERIAAEERELKALKVRKRELEERQRLLEIENERMRHHVAGGLS